MFEAFPLTVNPWLPVGVLWSTFLLIPESQLPPATRLPVPNPARIELLGWTGSCRSWRAELRWDPRGRHSAAGLRLDRGGPDGGDLLRASSSGTIVSRALPELTPGFSW